MLQIRKDTSSRQTDIAIDRHNDTKELVKNRQRLQKFASYRNDKEEKFKRPRRLRLRKAASYNNEEEERLNREAELAFLSQDREQLLRLENLKAEITAFKNRRLDVRHRGLYRDEDEATKIKIDSTGCFAIKDDEYDNDNIEAQEQQETKLDLENNVGNGVNKYRCDEIVVEEPFTNDQVSSLCKMLDCEKEDIYNSDYCESALKLILQNIKTMHSIILAQTAALKGRDEFHIGCEGGLSYDIKNDYSFAPIDELPVQQEPQGENLKLRFGKFSKRAGQRVKSFRLRAAMVDTYRKKLKR